MNFDFHGSSSIITKIRKINGDLVGITGRTVIAAHLFHWIENGCKEEEMPANQKDSEKASRIIRISPDGVVKIYENSHVPWINESPFVGIGAGGELAVGAMSFGATAYQAVEVAIKHCPVCGFGIDAISFDK